MATMKTIVIKNDLKMMEDILQPWKIRSYESNLCQSASSQFLAGSNFGFNATE